MFHKKSLFFHRRIIHIALPAFFAQISYPLIGITDTAVMGHFAGTSDLVAVNIGVGIFMAFAGAISFLRSSTLGLCAQAWGRGDHNALQHIAMRSFIIAIGVSLLAVIAGYVGFWLLAPKDADAELMQALEVYFDIRLLSLPAHAIGTFAVGVFLGLQNARDVLFFMLLVNLSNIFLNIVFVAGFGLGAAGIAAGSVIAEFLGVLYVAVRLHQLHIWRWIPRHTLFQFQAIKQLVNLNIHYFIRTVCLSISFALLPIVGASIGTEYAAANVLLLNLWFISSYSLDGIANAAEALSGRAIGRRMPRMLRRFILYFHGWSIPIILIFLAIIAIANDLFFTLQINDFQVISLAENYLLWLMLAILLCVPCLILDGVYYGAALGKEVSLTMMLACGLFGLCLWYLPNYMGNDGLWFAFNILFIARGLGLYIFLPRVMKLAVRV